MPEPPSSSKRPVPKPAPPRSAGSTAPRTTRGVRPEPSPSRSPRRSPDTRSEPRDPISAGPLARVVECIGKRLKGKSGYELGAGANALILLRRLAIATGTDLPREGEEALLHWAGTHDLGQDRDLVKNVAARRKHAVDIRVAAGRRRGVDVVRHRLLVRPMWRMVTGIGERTNPHEIGIALHGTYGWPVIPGSTLKGVTRAWASNLADRADNQKKPGHLAVDITRIFGPSPTANSHCTGSVDVLDSLPASDVLTVTVDGVTPHVQPYYTEASASAPRTAPGEWYNPVPSPFLTVSAGQFAVDVIGPESDCRQFITWCEEACDELGVGAKTGAGYGYLIPRRAAEPETTI
jgi:CRISPR type III-B/RAMP module RAMP protein Cmr6